MQDPNDNKTASLLDNLPPQGFRGVNPPMVGWYNAKRVSHFDAPWTARRWWNGTGWSMPCRIGSSDEEAEVARQTPSMFRPSEIEWQGLFSPARSFYPYLLEENTDRDALNCEPEDLDNQVRALTLRFWTEHAEDVGHDVTQQRLEAHAEPVKPLAHRRVFED